MMKKAIVIGASSGIGRELSKVLSGNGYSVGVMARRIELLDELHKEMNADIFIEQADISDTGSAMKKLENLIERMDGADLIVISAGTGYLNSALNWDLENETIRTNVAGFTAVANVAIKYFIKKGSGHLVGISSLASLRGGREAPAYNASKAFVSNYLEGLRQKVGRLSLPVIITDIKPGFVKTGMAKGEGVFWAASPEKAALQIYHAINRKKSNVYITKRWRLLAWILKLMPGSIYKKF